MFYGRNHIKTKPEFFSGVPKNIDVKDEYTDLRFVDLVILLHQVLSRCCNGSCSSLKLAAFLPVETVSDVENVLKR